MNEPLRARYIGYTKGTENHGDEALMWIISRFLAPEIEVGFEDEDYDIALLGGGTLINQSPWLIEHFGGMLSRARLGGLVFGTGVGDTTFWGDHLADWKELLKPLDLIGVRGPQSLAALHQIGISQARLIGDPYLAIRAPLLGSPVPRRIGVNIGSTNDSLWGGNDRDYFDFVCRVLAQLRDAGHTFLFLSVWSKDLPLVAELRDRLGVSDAPVIDARADSLGALAWLSTCDVFLGEKLHACAMAAVAEVPFIALEYQPKVCDFAESLGMGRQAISTVERDVDHLCHMLERLIERREFVRSELRVATSIHRANIEDFARRTKAHFALRRNTGGGSG